MTVEFTRWPDALAARYREKGYWQDLLLTEMVTRHAQSDAIAVIDGERAVLGIGRIICAGCNGLALCYWILWTIPPK